MHSHTSVSIVHAKWHLTMSGLRDYGHLEWETWRKGWAWLKSKGEPCLAGACYLPVPVRLDKSSDIPQKVARDSFSVWGRVDESCRGHQQSLPGEWCAPKNKTCERSTRESRAEHKAEWRSPEFEMLPFLLILVLTTPQDQSRYLSLWSPTNTVAWMCWNIFGVQVREIVYHYLTENK